MAKDVCKNNTMGQKRRNNYNYKRFGNFLWDIMGKYLNVPVYELLGGLVRERIRVYASAEMSKGRDDLINEALSYKDSGFTAIKIRIGNEDIFNDIETVTAVRNAIGRDTNLMVDACQSYVDSSWSFNAALHVARQLEECDLYWLEEPLDPDNIEDYARLAAAVDIPIAGGENEGTKYGFKELITRRAVDIPQPDAIRCGGILESKKIAALAQAYKMNIAPHIFTSGVSLMANMHFIASTPNVLVMEYDRTLNPLRDKLLVEPLKYENGYVYVNKNIPGLGVNLTDDIIKKYSKGCSW